jgi:glycosyltransferase involved in cell wall biosynthesis
MRVVVCSVGGRHPPGELPESGFGDRPRIAGGERSLYELAAAASAAGHEVELRGCISHAVYEEIVEHLACPGPRVGLAPRRATGDDIVVLPEGGQPVETYASVLFSPARVVMALLGPPGLYGPSFLPRWSPPDPISVPLSAVGTPEQFQAVASLGFELWSNSPGIAEAADKAGCSCVFLGTGTPVAFPPPPSERPHDVVLVAVSRWAPLAWKVARRAGVVPHAIPEQTDVTLAERLAEGRILIWPSRFEGDSRIQREARAVGTVPVALSSNTNAAGLDESSGAVVADSLDEIAEKVRRLIDDNVAWRQLSERAMASAREQVDWDTYVSRVHQALTDPGPRFDREPAVTLATSLVEGRESETRAGRWAAPGSSNPAGGSASASDRSHLPVSVIMPVHNGARYVRDAIESVSKQSQLPAELVIVDDGSTDDSLALLRSTSAPFPLRIIHQQRAGQSAARNHAVRHAEGDLVAFLDQDDRWKPRHLELLCAPLFKDPTVDWVYSDFDEIDADDRVITRAFLREFGIPHPKHSLEAVLTADLMVIPSASVLRRASFEQLGGFDESLQGYEDDDLYLRAFRSGRRLVFHRASLTSFRVHPHSSSALSTFATSRLRFSKKLVASVVDDPRLNRYYMRDVIAPRFFRGALDDYVCAVSRRDWVTAPSVRSGIRYFIGLMPDHAGLRWKYLLIRSPRRFRWLLWLNGRLPFFLRPAKNPILRLRQSYVPSGDDSDLTP